jgi:hypothetical protein
MTPRGGGDTLTETGDDLRSTSESIVADAEQLRSIEERKQALPEGHPELTTLSAEAERIARDLVPKTVVERELADERSEPA